ncbi:MAG: PfkB family carbohydrate kinase [Candidatus Micrarchaeia archaeon]|jgi:sugar/nucleoside kinase (ribokinase family)
MDLLCVGTPVIDMFARVGERELAALGVVKGATNFFSAEELGKIERKLSKKITYRYPGDNARNVCEGFAALGGFCGYAGAAGDDKAGAQFAANLSECGVGSFLQEKRGATGKILALVTPDKQRTFCADLGVSVNYDDVDRIAAKSARMLYVASITLCGDHEASRACHAYMEEFRKAGKKIALALESPPMVEKNRAHLLFLAKRYASALFLNEDEAAALLGADAEKKLPSLMPHVPVFLKRGENGSVLFLGGRAHRIGAIKTRALDTTGAGDAYAAGALYGLARGYTPLSSAKIGCYLATKVVEKFGAGVPLKHTRMPRRIGK